MWGQGASVYLLSRYALTEQIKLLVGKAVVGLVVHAVGDYPIKLVRIFLIVIHFISVPYGLFSIIIKKGEVGELRMFILVAQTLYLESEARYSHIILPSASPSA